MPSLQTARRVANAKNNGAKTIGQIHKEMSDFLMEETWDNDIQSKICYIYDYFHDNQPELKDHMTYDNTTKTRIEAKFIVKSYQSIDKDQVEYYIQFKPNQKLEFTEKDELYYFETDYRQRYGVEFPIGLMIDIPDEKGVYRKWLIAQREDGNQFLKYLILPCNFRLMWIEKNGQDRIKRKMWCVLRSQNSYNSGIYTYYQTTKMENQDKCWLPLNSITEKIWYTNDESKNMRVLVGAVTPHPIAWIISKVENAQPLGLQKITFYQSEFNPHTDYVNISTGEMFADYYDSNIEPTDPDVSSPTPETIYGQIAASNSTIKIGGSYKTLTLIIYDLDGNDATEQYKSAEIKWGCSVNDNSEVIDLTDTVSWLNTTSFNKIKMKFSNNRDFLGKILTIYCVVFDEHKGYINVSSQFELTI